MEKHMYKIALINMPFAALHLPSLALTQLKAVVDEKFGDRVSVDVLYLNHEYARHLGFGLYSHIVNAIDSHSSGLGDWFFRQSAFPEQPDNTDTYFKRYYPYRSEQMNMLKQLVVEKRLSLEGYANKLIARYHLADADIVGFTSMFTQSMACFALARRIKELNPKSIIAMGGANCESPMGQEIVKNVKAIDFVFSGPGLQSFPDFVEACISGQTDKCHRIQGVFSRRNYIFAQPNAIGVEVPLDMTITLNYEPFLRTIADSFPEGDVEPCLLFETSRGCWWGERAHCTFCGLNGVSMAYRSMSPDRALEQFESLFKYSPRVSHYESVDNILPKSYLQEVFPRLNPPANVDLFYEVKADLSGEDMKTLSRARVKSVQPGIESLATSTLKLMKKGTSVFQNLMLLKNCLLHDIWPNWNLLIGFPGEQDEVYKKYVKDIPLLFHLPPPSGVYPVRFDRYSPYFTQAEEYKLDLQPLDYYELTYPFSRESLANLAYYFADQNVGAAYKLEMSMWIDRIRERVNTWLAGWSSDANASEPKLYFKQNGAGTVVYDSRCGEAVEHSISDYARQVLEVLSPKPGRIGDLNNRLGHNPDFDGEKELALLQELGLVFREADRYLSLVLPYEPERMTVRR